MKQTQPRFGKDEELYKAIQYGVNHGKALREFLNNARIPIHNNRSEVELGLIGRGRTNFLFCGSEISGAYLAILYSVVRTCQRQGIDAWRYLSWVLPWLGHWKRNPELAGDIEDLMPMAFQKVPEYRQAG